MEDIKLSIRLMESVVELNLKTNWSMYNEDQRLLCRGLVKSVRNGRRWLNKPYWKKLFNAIKINV